MIKKLILSFLLLVSLNAGAADLYSGLALNGGLVGNLASSQPAAGNIGESINAVGVGVTTASTWLVNSFTLTTGWWRITGYVDLVAQSATTTPNTSTVCLSSNSTAGITAGDVCSVNTSSSVLVQNAYFLTSVSYLPIYNSGELYYCASSCSLYVKGLNTFSGGAATYYAIAHALRAF